MAETASPFAGDGPERQFRAGLAAGEFKIQHCGGCGRYVFYPRALCNHCGSPSLAWETASGDGTVYSTTIERTKPDAGGDKNIAVVELAEGPRLLTRITDIAPTEVTIGMKVKAHIGEADGIKMILFRKA